MFDFDSQYQKLNQQQKYVVDELGRNILLLAAAGTGKTNTLALRIVKLLQEGRAAPEQVLCLTFTNRACKEMKERIVSAVGPEGLKIEVRTFHSFCYELIQAFVKTTDLPSGFVIYDEDDCRELLSSFDLSLMGKGSIAAVQKFIDHIKEQRLLLPGRSNAAVIKHCYDNHYDKLEATCKERGGVNVAQFRFLLKFGAKLLKLYDRTLAERHALDFNDLLGKASEILSNPEYAASIAESYKFIHIDEVQDTSLIEYGIIQKIFGSSRLMLCGDYFQTIYQWRGSKPRDIFSGYERDYDPVRVVFDQNYRSTQVLLNASYAFLKASFPAQVESVYGGEIIAHAAQRGELITCKTARSVAEEAAWIYREIKRLNPPDLSRVAVLSRNNQHNQKLSEEFLKLNLEQDQWIDFLLADQFKFFRTKEVKDVLAFLKLLVNKYDDTSLERILLGYAKGVGVQTIRKLECKEHRALGIRLSDFVQRDTLLYGDPYDGLSRALYGKNVVVFDVESTGTDTSSDEIIQIAAVRIDETGRVLRSFEQLLHPSKPVGQSEAVHHFSDALLAERGGEPPQVLAEFCSFVRGAVVVGHNVGFDLTILASELSRLGLPPAEYEEYYDTLDLARRFYPDLPNHKLETLSKLLDTEVKSSHDAMDDILATKDVLLHLTAHKLLPTLQQRKAVYERYQGRFDKLSSTIESLRRASEELPLSSLLDRIMEAMRMKQLCEGEEKRLRNLAELREIAREMEGLSPGRLDCILAFLETAALSSTNLDRMLALKPRVPILTVHQAKGAEFDTVFLAGLQDDQFPSYFAQLSGDLDEERRTFYVAMTRAKQRLYLSCALEVDGRKKKPSRFLEDIPAEYTQSDLTAEKY